MTTEDIDKIRSLMNDFCTHALIPYIETYIHQLHDIVSLFATNKFTIV